MLQNSKNLLGKPTQVQAQVGNPCHDCLAKTRFGLSNLSTGVLGSAK